MELYIDIIRLFLQILRILGKLKNNNWNKKLSIINFDNY
jgi:hypothetical protein